MAKVKVATEWLTGCAGCHMSFLDIDERVVALADLVEFGSSPVTDLKRPENVTVGIIEGGVSNSSNLEFLKEMRENSQILIALGDCACWGCVPMLRNTMKLEDVLRRGYVETESTVNEEGVIPGHEDIAVLYDEVKPLRDFVKVDISIPGCPPSADAIWYVLTELLAGRMPVLEGDVLKYE